MMRRRVHYGKLFRFLFILVLIITLIVVGVSSCLKMTERTLKIGVSESSRPLAYLDDRKQPAGFEVDYANLLAERLDKKPSIEFIAPGEMAAALEDGEVDCVVSARQSVHDYIAEFDETAAFIEYGTVFTIAPDDESVGGEGDLGGKRVGVIINSEAERLCEELMDVAPFDVRLYDYEAQPFQELKLGKNDVVISDELYARYMQKEDAESYLVLETIYNMTGYGVRVSPKLSQEEQWAVEDAVDALRADVALSDIFLRWFGADLG